MKHMCDYGCGQEAKFLFKNGKWCCSKDHRSCPTIVQKRSDAQRESFGELVKITEERGFKLLSKKEEYKNQFSYLRFECSKGHIFSKRWDGFLAGYGCKECYWESKRTQLKEIENLMFDANYELLTTKNNYEKNHPEKVKVRCPNGHEYDTVFSDFKRGYRCKKCAGKKHSEWMKKRKIDNSFIAPNYNPLACKIIEKYGKDNGYNFQHAENGREFHVLSYWVDGYDKEKNIVIEVDESHHFDKNGNLNEKDVQRQKEITEFLGCKFIRLKINKDGELISITESNPPT